MGSYWKRTSLKPTARAAASSEAWAAASRAGSSSTKNTGRPSTTRSISRPACASRGALQVQQVAGDDVAEGDRAAGADVGVLLHQRRAEHALHRAHQAAVGAVDVGGDGGAAVQLGQRVQVLALGDVEHGGGHRAAALAVLRLQRHELHAGGGGHGDGGVGGAEVDRAVVAGVRRRAAGRRGRGGAGMGTESEGERGVIVRGAPGASMAAAGASTADSTRAARRPENGAGIRVAPSPGRPATRKISGFCGSAGALHARRGAPDRRSDSARAPTELLMPHSALTALSPLDGRYAAKLAALRPLMSEHGLMHRRVQVEVAWFIALSDAGFAEFKPLHRRRAQVPAAAWCRTSPRPTRRRSRRSRRPPTTT